MVAEREQFGLTDTGMARIATTINRRSVFYESDFDLLVHDFSQNYQPQDVTGFSPTSIEDALEDPRLNDEFRDKMRSAILMKIEPNRMHPNVHTKDQTMTELEDELKKRVKESIRDTRSRISKSQDQIDAYAEVSNHLQAASIKSARELPEEVNGVKVDQSLRDFFADKNFANLIKEKWYSVLDDQVVGAWARLASDTSILENLFSLDDTGSKDPEVVSEKIFDTARAETIDNISSRLDGETIRYGLKDFLLSEEGLATKDRHGVITIDKEKLRSFRLAELRSAGLNTLPITEERTYVIGSDEGEHIVIPGDFRDACLKDYVAHCESIADPEQKKERKKVEFARAVFEERADFKIGRKVGALYKDVRKRLIKNVGAIDKEATLGDFLGDEGAKSALESIALEELQTFISTKNSKDSINMVAKGMETFLRRYKPDEYEKSFGWGKKKALKKARGFTYNLLAPLGKSTAKFATSLVAFDKSIFKSTRNAISGLAGIVGHTVALPFRAHSLRNTESKAAKPDTKKLPWEGKDSHVYEIQVTSNGKKIRNSARSTSVYGGGSCIRHYDQSYFDEVANDSGTIYLVGKQDGVDKGYARAFLMKERDSGDPVLAIDTIEPPGKKFETHKGFINALALASIKLAVDMGAKYVIGSDSRVGYGARQAYSSVEKKVSLTKLGLSTPKTQYTIGTNAHDGSYDGTPTVLFENWNRVAA